MINYRWISGELNLALKLHMHEFCKDLNQTSWTIPSCEIIVAYIYMED